MTPFFENKNTDNKAQMVKNLPAMRETQIRSPSGEDPLKKGMATHSSILTVESHRQRSLIDYNPWRCRVWHDFHFHSYLGELLFGICNEDFINLCFLNSILYISICALFGVLQKSGSAFVTLKNLVKWNGKEERERGGEGKRRRGDRV